jgi:hypothetical protein
MGWSVFEEEILVLQRAERRAQLDGCPMADILVLSLLQLCLCLALSYGRKLDLDLLLVVLMAKRMVDGWMVDLVF